MARTARKQSETGVYHAIIRGVNKQQIFECEEDFLKFRRILKAQTEFQEYEGHLTSHCTIFAYCQMNNHVHILLKEGDESIGDTMKRIASTYVYYYNHKYERIGHLFQERFKSQPVNDNGYFLRLLRYIHQNPLKACIVDNVADYTWSSWHEYIGKAEDGFCDTKSVFDFISYDELVHVVSEPLCERDEEDLIDVDVKHKDKSYTDTEVQMMICECSKTCNITEFQKLPKPEQKRVLLMVNEYGVGPRTLSRLTGVPYSVIYKATLKARDTGMFGRVSEGCFDDELYYDYCDSSEFEMYPEY